MTGRSAIRNPWIFTQLRQYWRGQELFKPTLQDVRGYIDDLHRATWSEGIPEKAHLGRLKKFLNFIGLGVDEEGRFLYQMRRAHASPEFFGICDAFLVEGGNAEKPFPEEPYDGLVARPNCEVPKIVDLPACCG